MTHYVAQLREISRVTGVSIYISTDYHPIIVFEIGMRSSMHELTRQFIRGT